MAKHFSQLEDGHWIEETEEEYNKRTGGGCGIGAIIAFVFVCIVLAPKIFDDTDSKEGTTKPSTISSTQTESKISESKKLSSESLKEKSISVSPEKSVDAEMKKIVQLWTKYHNAKDISGLMSLYADNVMYYQSNYSKDKVLSSKQKLFAKYPFFHQEVTGIDVEEYSSFYKLSFRKAVQTVSDGEIKTYPSYLFIKNINGAWKITTESDLVTDKNLSKKK